MWAVRAHQNMSYGFYVFSFFNQGTKPKKLSLSHLLVLSTLLIQRRSFISSMITSHSCTNFFFFHFHSLYFSFQLLPVRFRHQNLFVLSSYLVGVEAILNIIIIWPSDHQVMTFAMHVCPTLICNGLGSTGIVLAYCFNRLTMGQLKWHWK